MKLSAFLQYASYALVFVTIWFLWPRELDGFLVGKDGRLSVPDYAMTNARYVSVKEGHVEMETITKEASFDLIHRRMDAQEVTAHFFNSKDEKTKVLSERATYYLDERRMHLLGNVQSESSDGFLIRGPEALYHLNKKFFVAPQPVVGETKKKDLQVWGDRAESNLDDSKVHLIGNARAMFVEQKRGPTNIRGEKAELDRQAEEIKFFQNVQVEQERTVATGQNASLFYSNNKSNRSLRYMSIFDDVKIVDLDSNRHTRSQVAEFFAPTDTIVLTVFPSVYDGDDAVTGDRITLYRATGVVEVTATNAAGKSENLEQKKRQQPSSAEDEELIP